MDSKKGKPKSIEEYIDAAPDDARAKLLQLHRCIKAAAPRATEGLKWSMPSYSYDRILVTFKVFRKHIGLYVTPSTVNAFAKDLLKYNKGMGSIQFPLEEQLPIPLIGRIVKFRVRESLKEDVKWRSGRGS